MKRSSKTISQLLFINKAQIPIPAGTQETLGALFPRHMAPERRDPRRYAEVPGQAERGDAGAAGQASFSLPPASRRLLLSDKVPPPISAKSSGSARPERLGPVPKHGTQQATASPLQPLIILLLCVRQLLSRNSGSPMTVKTADKKIVSRILHFKKADKRAEGEISHIRPEVLTKAESSLNHRSFQVFVSSEGYGFPNIPTVAEQNYKP